MNKEKYKTWCCWTLDEEEIYHVAEKVLNSKNPVGLITDDEIEEIAEDFKNAISIAFEDWEESLEEIIKNVVVKR